MAYRSQSTVFVISEASEDTEKRVKLSIKQEGECDLSPFDDNIAMHFISFLPRLLITEKLKRN